MYRRVLRNVSLIADARGLSPFGSWSIGHKKIATSLPCCTCAPAIILDTGARLRAYLLDDGKVFSTRQLGVVLELL